jgi:hypothetical protein
LNLLEHHEPVELRQNEVQQDEVVALLQRPLDRLRPGPRPIDQQTVGGQPASEEVEDTGLVFDDEDAAQSAPLRFCG